jgi:hypothetical protein
VLLFDELLDRGVDSVVTHEATVHVRSGAMQFDTKVAVVLGEDLAVWQKANVTAFLISGIAGSDPSLVGEPYVDGSGNRYLPMLRQPVLVYAADGPGLRRAYERAMQRGAEQLAIYTAELFETAHDEANRAAVAAVPADELDLVGIALRAERKTVDKVLDRLRPHA